MIVLPLNIKNSKILTREQRELLSQLDRVPVVDPSFEDDKLKNIFQYYSLMPEDMDRELHRYAGELLNQHRINEAWQVLLSSEIV